MTPCEQYRTLATKLRAKAHAEGSALLKAEWEHLALSYLRLAEQAEKNGRTDVSYEPILQRRAGDLGREPA